MRSVLDNNTKKRRSHQYDTMRIIKHNPQKIIGLRMRNKGEEVGFPTKNEEMEMKSDAIMVGLVGPCFIIYSLILIYMLNNFF